MKLLTEIKPFRFSKKDIEIQDKLKEFDIHVPKFVRDAIKEKFKRDWPKIKLAKEKEKCPF